MLNNVEFVSVDAAPAGKTKKVDLTFKHLSGKFAGQTWTKGNLVPNLDKESLSILKESSAGDVVAIEITKKGDFYNLTKVRPSQSSTSGSTASSKAGNTGSSYDNVGIKVGAARNQAIAFLAATKGTQFTLDDVDAIAYQIVIRQANQEDAVRAGANPSEPQPVLDAVADTAEVEVDTTEELGF